MIRQSQSPGQLAQLADVTLQGDGVDLKVLRRKLPLTAQVYLNGAAADDAANGLLELRFEKVIRFAGAKTDFQIAIVDGAQFNGKMERIALIIRLPVARHAAQHAHLLSLTGERPALAGW